VILGDYEHGQPLLDTHMPALLEERLYHADGQISEEVYVYGSFLQSLMYQKGVTCSDCHEPHGLNLIAEGNNLCSRCHTPEAYDSPSHHFHQVGSTGASCVECHMPERTYMVVDPRRDHSIRIPRPDLSVRLGTPNACVLCHVDQSDQWAVDAVSEWYPPDAAAPPHYAEALDAGRKGSSGAGVALSELVMNEEAPGLVRASALVLLDPMDTETTLRAIGSGVADDDPLLRRAALIALAEAQEGARLPLGYPLLLDPIRGVRIQAVNTLASVRSRMTNAQQEVFDRAAAEYIAAQMANADRFMSHINLGLHYLHVGQRAEAETSYRTAMRLDPSSIQPHVNLADLYREQGRDDLGESLLRDALRLSPASAEVHHALGLLLVRVNRNPEALVALQRAANLRPANARFAYAYALCLYEDQQVEAALQALRQTHRRHPEDRDVLWSLILIHRELGRKNEALLYARRLVILAPDNPDFVGLLQEIERDG
jgi:tetratricopeptide (TPR) repeat protein